LILIVLGVEETFMGIGWFWDRIENFAAEEVLWAHGQSYSYQQLQTKSAAWQQSLTEQGIATGACVAVIGEYGLSSIALLLALIRLKAVIVPLTHDEPAIINEYIKVANVEAVIDFGLGEAIQRLAEGQAAMHPLMVACRDHDTAGVVIFTSGSTGKSKAVLYRIDHLINKFNTPVAKQYRALVFLKFDHIGGINTVLAMLSQGGTMVVSPSRQAESVCQLIQQTRINLLPTTPSFLNMLLLSQYCETYDLSSLQVITYGTEVMPQSTLMAMTKQFPHLKLKQTYGLTELGIMSTQSKSNQSKWIKLGGDGVEWKVVDDILWIKTATPMLGYLNAPSPFDDEGWYNTQDQVEVDGEYLKILGRKSEIINVGGEKVYPQEVEDVLLEMPNVAEVLVRGVSNPVTGQTICAELILHEEEDLHEFRLRMRRFCKDKLARFKIPTQVRLSEKQFTGKRLKKSRLEEARS
jgi:acyl-CoA synthetase (AMP-forming)/AMP-acid ligase II